jgi:hypothetical protein
MYRTLYWSVWSKPLSSLLSIDWRSTPFWSHIECLERFPIIGHFYSTHSRALHTGVEQNPPQTKGIKALLYPLYPLHEHDPHCCKMQYLSLACVSNHPHCPRKTCLL